MGIEIEVNSLEEMCDLMCNNRIPKKKSEGRSIVYHFDGTEIRQGKLKGRKLLSDGKCIVCNKSDNLYVIEYENTDFSFVHYGIHCIDCFNKIFRIK